MKNLIQRQWQLMPPRSCKAYWRILTANCLALSLLALLNLSACSSNPPKIIKIQAAAQAEESFLQYQQVFASEQYDQLYQLLSKSSQVNALVRIRKMSSQQAEDLKAHGFLGSEHYKSPQDLLGAFTKALLKSQKGERERIVSLKLVGTPIKSKSKCRLLAKGPGNSKAQAYYFVLENGLWKLKDRNKFSFKSLR